MFTDFKAAGKAFVHLLAISAIWYGLEFMEFGTLQWNRTCDEIIGLIFFFILWKAYHTHNVYVDEIIKICKLQENKGDG